MTHLALSILFALMPLLGTPAVDQDDQWPNKPQLPLERSDPIEYQIGLGIDIGAAPEAIAQQRVLQASGGTFTINLITAGNWALAAPARLTSSLHINGQPAQVRQSVSGKQGDESYTALIQIPKANISALSLRVEWPVISFDSSINEELAARATWPRQWPAEALPYLAPSPFIPSGEKEYTAFVERVSEGKVRDVPMYYAAKDLVRAAILEHRNVRAEFVFSENEGAVRGYDLKTAREAWQRSRSRSQTREATASDLVANCIAVLRAAGIPARPVIGLQSGSIINPAIVSTNVKFVAWGEFYLPGAGWVPFDPNLMRGTSMTNMSVRKPWRFFGTFEHLNRRAAIAYDFAPMANGMISEFPCGWSLNVSGVANGRFQFVDVTSPIMVLKGDR